MSEVIKHNGEIYVKLNGVTVTALSNTYQVSQDFKFHLESVLMVQHDLGADEDYRNLFNELELCHADAFVALNCVAKWGDA